jgi:UDP-N-acetyl-D-mannosaminuronic acid transferase (WecB/TagA/CpsF family)
MKYKNIDADIVWVSLGFPKQEMFIDQVIKQWILIQTL